MQGTTLALKEHIVNVMWIRFSFFLFRCFVLQDFWLPRLFYKLRTPDVYSEPRTALTISKCNLTC